MRNITFLIVLFFTLSAQATNLKHNTETKTILIADEAELLQIQIDYSKGCKIGQVNIRGRNGDAFIRRDFCHPFGL